MAGLAILGVRVVRACRAHDRGAAAARHRAPARIEHRRSARPAQRHAREPVSAVQSAARSDDRGASTRSAACSTRAICSANRSYQLTRSLDGLFREFRYVIDTDRLLRVVRVAGAAGAAPAFNAEIVALPKEIELAAVCGRDRARAPVARRRLRGGRARTSSWRCSSRRSSAAKSTSTPICSRRSHRGAVRARRRATASSSATARSRPPCSRTTAGRITAFRFAGATASRRGTTSRAGRSSASSCSRRCRSSRASRRGFSYRRLHPVHGTTRAHLGVDYGAPAGTPVQAVASGVVEVAGWSGEAGRMVRLRHAGGYETAYLHLSSFGPGIRPGARVEPGRSHRPRRRRAARPPVRISTTASSRTAATSTRSWN